MNCQNTAIEHIQGDTLKKLVTIRDKDGNPIDLTGSAFIFTIRKNYTSAVLIQEAAAIVAPPTGGKVQILVSAATMNIDTGNYVYDLQWTDSNGYVKTILIGGLVISPGVT